MFKLLAIAFGGAVGSLLRVYGSEWVVAKTGLHPVHGTMAVNLFGALLIGLCIGFLQAKPDLPTWVRFLIISGGLGGFTTFSSFIYELIELLIQESYYMAFYYGAIQLIGGVILCWLALAISRILF